MRGAVLIFLKIPLFSTILTIFPFPFLSPSPHWENSAGATHVHTFPAIPHFGHCFDSYGICVWPVHLYLFAFSPPSRAPIRTYPHSSARGNGYLDTETEAAGGGGWSGVFFFSSRGGSMRKTLSFPLFGGKGGAEVLGFFSPAFFPCFFPFHAPKRNGRK